MINAWNRNTATIKLFATLSAKLALQGYQVHPIATGGYFVAKLNYYKLCPTLDDLQAFADAIGSE